MKNINYERVFKLKGSMWRCERATKFVDSVRAIVPIDSRSLLYCKNIITLRIRFEKY